MSFTDPLTVVISPTTYTLPRTSVVGDETEYTDPTGLVRVRVSHEKSGKNKRARRMIRLDTTKLSPDTFKPTENVENSMSIYMVFDIPIAGFSPSEQRATFNGFKTLIDPASGTVIDKLLSGES